MLRPVRWVVVAALGSAGCIGETAGPPPLTDVEVVARLRALPGVTVEEPTVDELPPGLRYYRLAFTQPIDHDDPGRGTFQQRVSLLHRDARATSPMIVYTSGYADTWGTHAVELTTLLAGNQISIEHRFFGTSRPAPADWSKLTIAQMAADEHEVIAALRTVYDGAFLTTGTSKGGMTAVFHRRFYPDDVDGTVSYVAPLSFDAPDLRYQAYFDQIGSDACRAAVRAVASELLRNRRDAVVALAEQQAGHAYTRVGLGPAVESAIVSLEWSFWQNRGAAFCAEVPAETAATEALFAFLDATSPVSGCDDRAVATYEAYVYQAHAQLGYPEAVPGYLAPWLAFGDADFLGELPTPAPRFDSAAMRDIDEFVEHQGERLLFVYGAWDPWTAGRFPLGDAVDSAVLLQAEGTHKARIATLGDADRGRALAMLEAWTGVTPVLGRLQAAHHAHEPVAVPIRALRISGK